MSATTIKIIAVVAVVAILVALLIALVQGADAAKKSVASLSDVGETMAKSAQQSVPSYATTPRNASGTNYWRGGLTSVHETGAEIIDLPRGTRIIPHGLSVNAANQGRAEQGETVVNNNTYNLYVQMDEVYKLKNVFTDFSHNRVVFEGVD